MTNTTSTPRKHWTDAQVWESDKSGTVMTAGALLKLYRAELRRVSLCCATFTVHAGGESWKRIS
jgi:hypothetical protein